MLMRTLETPEKPMGGLALSKHSHKLVPVFKPARPSLEKNTLLG
jgi:hypothetical protein